MKIKPYSFLGWVASIIFLAFLTGSLGKVAEETTAFDFVKQGWQLLLSAKFLESLWITILRFLLGYFLALIVASAIGLAIGRNSKLEAFSAPLINILRPVPSVVVIPIAMIFMKYGSLTMLVFVVFYGAFWPILLQVAQGAKDIEPTLIDTGLTLGKTRLEILRKIEIPAVLPSMFVGARIAIGVGLLLVVTCEILVSGDQKGLGYLLLDAERNYRYGELAAMAVSIGLLGYVFNLIFDLIEPRVLTWHSGRNSAI